MANPNIPRGLQPYAYAWGAPWGGAVRTYYVPAGNATALFFGDPVALVSNSSDGNGVPVAEIATAGAGNYLLGCFQGLSNNAGQATIPVLQNQTPYLAAGQAAYIYVADDPFLLFEIQENGAMASGAGGGGASLVAGAGSTVTSFSGWQINSATLEHNGGTPQQMRIIQALQQIDNAPGQNAKWLAKINQHQWLNAASV